MRYRVVITARARADAVAAFRWIADRSPRAADRWYAGLAQAITALETNPESHPIAQDETEQLDLIIRQRLHGRRRGVHRLLFSIEGDCVTLHFIHHAARGPIEP